MAITTVANRQLRGPLTTTGDGTLTFDETSSFPGPVAGQVWWEDSNDLLWYVSEVAGGTPSQGAIPFGVSGGKTVVAANTSAQEIVSVAYADGYLNTVARRVQAKFALIGDGTALANTFTFTLSVNGVTFATITTPAVALGTVFYAVVTVDLVTLTTGASGTIAASVTGSGAVGNSGTQIGTPVNYAIVNTVTADLTGSTNVELDAAATLSNATDKMGVLFADIAAIF